MSDRYAEILAQALESIDKGECTLAECLEQYPEVREELAELFEVARLYQNYSLPSPSARFRYAARSRILAQVKAQEPVSFLSRFRRKLQNAVILLQTKPAMAIALTAALLVSLVGVGSVYASQDSLPGELLYSVKLAVEDAKLAITPEEGDIKLYRQFAGERIREAMDLVEQERYEDIPVVMERFEVQVEEAVNSSGPTTESEPETLSMHIITLTELLEKVPDAAKDAIEHAITASSKQDESEDGLGDQESEMPPADLPSVTSPEVKKGPPDDLPVDLPEAVPDDLSNPAEPEPDEQPTRPGEPPGPPEDHPGSSGQTSGPKVDRPGRHGQPPGRPENIPGPRGRPHGRPPGKP